MSSEIVLTIPTDLSKVDFFSVKMPNGATKLVEFESFNSVLSAIFNDVSNEGAARGKTVVSTTHTYPTNCMLSVDQGSNGTQRSFVSYYHRRKSELKVDVSGKIQKYMVDWPNIIIRSMMEKNPSTKKWGVIATYFYMTDVPCEHLQWASLGLKCLTPEHKVIPLSIMNCYGDGKVCYGKNAVPVTFDEGAWRPLDLYYSFLLDSPYNYDLGIRNQDTTNMSPSEFIKLWSESKYFPMYLFRGGSPYSNKADHQKALDKMFGFVEEPVSEKKVDSSAKKKSSTPAADAA